MAVADGLQLLALYWLNDQVNISYPGLQEKPGEVNRVIGTVLRIGFLNMSSSNTAWCAL